RRALRCCTVTLTAASSAVARVGQERLRRALPGVRFTLPVAGVPKVTACAQERGNWSRSIVMRREYPRGRGGHSRSSKRGIRRPSDAHGRGGSRFSAFRTGDEAADGVDDVAPAASEVLLEQHAQCVLEGFEQVRRSSNQVSVPCQRVATTNQGAF